MKKIVFISHSTNFAGAEQYLYHLISKIDKTHYEIYVFCPFWGNQILVEKLKQINGIELFQFNFKSALFLKTNIPRMIVNVIFQLYAATKLAMFVKKRKIDIIYSNTTLVIFGGIVSRMVGIRHIWNIHESIRGSNYKFILGNSIYQVSLSPLFYMLTHGDN